MKNFKLNAGRLTRGLSLLLVATCICAWSICVVFAIDRSRATPSPSPSPSATPTPSPPVIEFLAVPDHEIAKRNESIEVSLLISNKSDKPVQLLDVALAGNSGENAAFTGNLGINSELKPFTSESTNLTVTVTDYAPFTQNKVLLKLRYSWNMGHQPVISTQSAAIPIGVQRPFEDEAKGFPGGTAAFLYFLLPIIPALLSYQLLERYRKGEGWRMPTFGSDQIVPAFFLAVVLSFLIVAVAKGTGGINYSNPVVFALVLGISLAVGAIIPLIRLLRDLYVSQTWGFKDNDCGACYLRKALLSPWTPPKFDWVTGKVGRVTWQGIQLEQPSGAIVLGATVQIFCPDGVAEATWEQAKNEVLDGDVIKNRERLVELVEAGTFGVRVLDPIEQGSRALDTFVAVGKVKGFQQTNVEVRNLLRPLT